MIPTVQRAAHLGPHNSLGACRISRHFKGKNCSHNSIRTTEGLWFVEYG